jgi:hypothetical protein
MGTPQALEKRVDDLGEHDVLGQDDLALEQLEPGFGVSAKEVFAPADPDVDLVLEAVLVAEELAVDVDLVALDPDDLHVGHDVLEA